MSILLPLILMANAPLQMVPQRPSVPPPVTEGCLRTPSLICPLKRTEVKGIISGSAAEVSVVQVFTNPSPKPIEAVYTFPLPAEAAVNRMAIRVGDVVTQAEIQRRADAEAIYQRARQSGQVAALLSQERENIFTQSVANIMPGAEVRVEIRYVQAVKYERGRFEFNFPMVVGPRNISQAADPGKISPPVSRNGSTISLSVQLHTGAPVTSLSTPLHAVTIRKESAQSALIQLKKQDEIPNRDFILRYQLDDSAITPSVLSTFQPGLGGTASIEVVPPAEPAETMRIPREVFLVMDQSGSQHGFPIEKSKELTRRLIQELRPGDTFNVFGFNTQVRSVFGSSQSPSPEAKRKALAFVDSMQATGGTNILEGIRQAMASQDPNRLRIVVLNTDGYVGNEQEIIGEIQKNVGNARIFTFGVGNSVNRFLVDAMSETGRGASETVTLSDGADSAIQRFLDRTRFPVLRDVKVKVDGVDAVQMVPEKPADVFVGQPILVSTRYQRPGLARVVIEGTYANGKTYRQELVRNFTGANENPSLSSRWARERIREISRTAALRPDTAQEAVSSITTLGLRYALVTEHTSFVAVDKRVVNVNGKQMTIAVPVNPADGVSLGPATYDAAGTKLSLSRQAYGRGSVSIVSASPAAKSVIQGPGAFGGMSGGAGGGSMGGGVGGSMGTPPGSAQMGESLRAANPQAPAINKIEPALRKAKGNVTVQVLCSTLGEKELSLIQKAGLKIVWKDLKNSVLIGEISVTKLKALANLAAVLQIRRVEEKPEVL